MTVLVKQCPTRAGGDDAVTLRELRAAVESDPRRRGRRLGPLVTLTELVRPTRAGGDDAASFDSLGIAEMSAPRRRGRRKTRYGLGSWGRRGTLVPGVVTDEVGLHWGVSGRIG